MKVGKKQNPSSSFWQPTGTYDQKNSIRKKNSLKSGKFLYIFSMKNPLY
jgi:hypothetical protein